MLLILLVLLLLAYVLIKISGWWIGIAVWIGLVCVGYWFLRKLYD
jgi:hypothetical protein